MTDFEADKVAREEQINEALGVLLRAAVRLPEARQEQVVKAVTRLACAFAPKRYLPPPTSPCSTCQQGCWMAGHAEGACYGTTRVLRMVGDKEGEHIEQLHRRVGHDLMGDYQEYEG